MKFPSIFFFFFLFLFSAFSAALLNQKRLHNERGGPGGGTLSR